MSKLKILLLAAGTAAQAQMKKECFYQGKAYSDGAKNPAGQVCEGKTGTWK
ncbi:MAG: hypothetical protein WA322_18885 [Pseudolabrys sp.]